MNKSHVKVISLYLKTELEKSQKQAEELSSLIQTLLKEKNDEMDLLNVQLQQNEQERETSNHLLVKHVCTVIVKSYIAITGGFIFGTKWIIIKIPIFSFV